MVLRPIADSRAVLNHALNLQRFSLANYVRFAKPWANESDRGLLSVLSNIAEAHTEGATRVGQLLVERHACVNGGAFPARFTALNDLSVRHVAAQMVEDLERNVRRLRSCAEALNDDVTAREIVDELLHEEQHHLRTLRDALNLGLENGTANRQSEELGSTTQVVRHVYGDAINRWINEGGALAEEDEAVHSPRPSPQFGQKSDREASLQSVLQA